MNNIVLKSVEDMDVKDVIGKPQDATMHYYNGDKRKIYYTDKETEFPKGEKIISVSDLNGNIVTANSTFAYMSGFTRRELIGMPHNVLRHPDMPQAAFKEMWASLKETGAWKGYVKNLRKDGGFYWVHASIFTLTRHGKAVGYTSSRSEAPRDKIETYSEHYQRLLTQE